MPDHEHGAVKPHNTERGEAATEMNNGRKERKRNSEDLSPRRRGAKAGEKEIKLFWALNFFFRTWRPYAFAESISESQKFCARRANFQLLQFNKGEDHG